MSLRLASPFAWLVCWAFLGCGRIGFVPEDVSSSETDAGLDGARMDVPAFDAPADGGGLDGGPVDGGQIDGGDIDDAGMDAPGADSPTSDAALLDTPDAPLTPDAGVALGNVAFVTRALRNGAVGSRAAVDAICVAEAASAGLTGTFIAYLDDGTGAGHARLGTASGWVRPDGRTVAVSADALLSDRLYYPIILHADGAATVGAAAWTGFTSDCAGWTSAAMADRGGTGNPTTVDRRSWFGIAAGMSSSPCADADSFYCVQIDHAAGAPAPSPVPGRHLFVSDRLVAPTPDAVCEASRIAAGLTGTYRALVAYTGVSALSRVTLDGRPWIRMDGLPVFSDDAAVAVGSPELPVYFGANGLVAVNGPATGAASLSTSGTAETTCADWTLTAGGGSTTGFPLSVGRAWFQIGLSSCVAARAFYCLQD